MDSAEDEIASNNTHTFTSNFTGASQRKGASKTAPYYTKNSDGDYSCKVCEESDPSKETILKKDKTGSTHRLWKHLEKHHFTIYMQLKPLVDQPLITDLLSKSGQYSGIDVKQTKDACLELVVFTDAPFSLLDNPIFKIFCSYLVQGNPKLPCAMTVCRALDEKFANGKNELRELLRPVRKVSLTADTWTTSNNVAIFGITVHWIDDTWTLCERVLAVEELRGSHKGAHLSDVLLRVLKDFHLTNKLCAITTDNASNNGTMIATLVKDLGYNNSQFSKQYHAPCIAHVLNLAVQRGLKELGAWSTPPILSDEEGEECGRTFGEVIIRLRKLVIAAMASPQRVHIYKGICKELHMPNSNLLVEDLPTRWNSTHNMIEVAWEKRKVLAQMVENYFMVTETNYSITPHELNLLKRYADELLGFRDVTEILSKSKEITSSTVLRSYQLLLDELDSLVDALHNQTYGDTENPMTNEQTRILVNTYTVMKEKMLKYEPHLKKKPIFPIATVLDPQIKLTYIPLCDYGFILENLIQLLDLVQTSSAGSTGRHNPTTSESSSSNIKRSRVALALFKRNATSTTTIERSTRSEMDAYLSESCFDGISYSSLDWWHIIGCHKYPRLAVLAKEFLSICATSAPAERLFSRGRRIVTDKRGRLAPETISLLMTLKCWANEELNEDDEDDEVEMEEFF